MQKQDSTYSPSFKWRKFVSISLAFSFAMMSLSGVILYLAPPGRVARWSEWSALGLLKDQWEAQHTVFSYLFIAFVVWHLFFINWKAFISYLKRKSSSRISKELSLSSLVFVFIFSFILLEWQPFSPIMELSEHLSKSWSIKGYAPPRPHAEELPLSQLAEEVIKCSTEDVLTALKELQIEASATDCIKVLAQERELSSMELYKLLVHQIENKKNFIVQ